MDDPILSIVRNKKREEDLEDNVLYFCSHELHWDYDKTMNAPLWYVMRLMKKQNELDKEQKKKMKSKRGRK